MQDFTSLSETIGQYFWPMIRFLGLFVSVPLFNERVVISKLKINLAMLVTFLISPGLNTVKTPLFSMSGLWLIISQFMIGIIVGLIMQFAFSVVHFAGEVIGLQMGLSFATFFDPFIGFYSPILSRLFNALFLLLFISLDMHLLAIKVLFDTFQLLPIAPLSFNKESFLLLTNAAGILFSYGLMLSLPTITLLLLLNIALGVLNRLVPQLSLFVIGFPIILGVGLILLTLVISSLPKFTEELFRIILHYLSSILILMKEK